MAAAIPAPLSEGYYLDNFNVVLGHVCRTSVDLLNDDERSFETGFRNLSTGAQRLFVRLLSRKGPLFRIARLSYAEIDCEEAAARELINAGFADGAPDAGTESLLALLLKAELLSLAPEQPARVRRDELIEWLTQCFSPEQARAAITGGVIRLCRLECLDTFRLLFFGNLDQDFTEFILDELGITPYERYSLSAEDRLFDDRDSIERTLKMYALRALARECLAELTATELIALADAVPEIRQPQSRDRAGRLLTRIARQLERLGADRQALAVYRRTAVAPSSERQARIHAARGEDAEVLRLCSAMLSEPREESEYEFAVQFAHARARKAQFSLIDWPAARKTTFSYESTSLPAQIFRVEEIARQHFEARGDEAWYVENLLFPGLFGLAFWDIIFHPVRGAFLHPFQRGPLDMFTPEFRRQRASLIEARLDDISEPQRLAERIWSVWSDRFPRANFFVHWGGLSEGLIAQALERIPPRDLIAIFRRLLRDPRCNRSGFPDLIVFPSAGGYRLVEIKGPGDTLQANQKRWLTHFDEHSIPAEVMGVEWQ